MGKELAVINKFAVSTMDREAMADEMEGLQVSFDRVKIPSGGGLAFEVPGDDPDEPDTEKELVGVVVDHHPVNAYWIQKYEGQNNPPDCSSADGKTGYADPESGLEWAGRSNNCADCPLNAWGSAEDGIGKACKNMHRVYVLREGEVLPLLLTLPPTSLKNLSNYLAKRVVGKGLRATDVLTKVTLKKAQSKGGITYSQAAFQVAGRLSPELSEQMKQFKAQVKPITRGVEVGADDYIAEGNGQRGNEHKAPQEEAEAIF